MGWPQITLIVLVAMTTAIYGVKHGQSRGNYNFGFQLVDVAVLIGLLYAGGFFSTH